MNIVEAKEIFTRYYPNLPLAVKHAVKFTLENWDALKETPLENVPITFIVEEALDFLKSLPKLPTDAREEDKDFIEKINRAVFFLQGDLNVWLSLEDLPHEEWRGVVGYETRYLVSNYGRIKSLYCNKVTMRNLIRKPVVIKDGYVQVSLTNGESNSRVGRGAHFVVAQAFIPNPEGKPIVNHEDGNPWNNCVWNLNWTTNGENQKHATKIGTKKIGYENPLAKLTPEDVRYIRSHYIPRHKEFGLVALAKKFNVGTSTIKRILNGSGYRNVD